MNLQNQIDYYKTYIGGDILDGIKVPSGLDLDRVKSAIVLRCGLLTPLYSEPTTMHDAILLWSDSMQWNFQHLVKLIQTEYKPLENYNRTEKASSAGENVTTGSTVEETTSNGSQTETHSGTDARTINTEKIDSGEQERTRSESEAHTGTDTTTTSGSGTKTETHSGNDNKTITNTISAENVSGYQDDDKTDEVDSYGHVITTADQTSGTSALQHGEQIETSETENVTDSRSETEETTDNLSHGEVIETIDRRTTSGTGSSRTQNVQNGSNQLHAFGNIGITTSQTMALEEINLISRFNPYKWIAEQFENELCIMLY